MSPYFNTVPIGMEALDPASGPDGLMSGIETGSMTLGSQRPG